MHPIVVEVIGYLASGLVVLSLAMSSVVRLRIASATGSLVFIAYGALLGSVPLIITNIATLALNAWYLRKEFSPNRDLGAVPIEPDAPFLLDFLRSHSEDIADSHPDFAGTGADHFALMLTRDGLPAGALLGRPDGRTLHVDLDYVMKAYRDSRIGTWLYGKGTRVFREAGFTRLEATPATEVHRSYLLRVGFVDEGYALAVNLA